MSGSDILFAMIVIPLQLIVAYFVILALLRGYKSESRIRDLTSKVQQLQAEIETLERKSGKSKEK